MTIEKTEKALREFLKRKKMPVQVFALKAGLPVSTVAAILTGAKVEDEATAVKLELMTKIKREKWLKGNV